VLTAAQTSRPFLPLEWLQALARIFVHLFP
jgi:hypothetical protein